MAVKGEAKSEEEKKQAKLAKSLKKQAKAAALTKSPGKSPGTRASPRLAAAAAKKMEEMPTLGLESPEAAKAVKKEKKEKKKRKAEALEAEATEEAPKAKKAKKEKKEKTVEVAAKPVQSGAEWRKEFGINVTGEFENGIPEPYQTFAACPFDERILKTLNSSGFEAPTPVPLATISCLSPRISLPTHCHLVATSVLSNYRPHQSLTRVHVLRCRSRRGRWRWWGVT
jgi:hypothetical protein